MEEKRFFTLKDIGLKIEGKVIGDENYLISGVKDFATAGENDITFAETESILNKALKFNVGAIITNKQIDTDKNLILVNYPKLAFALCVELFANEPEPLIEISERSYIDSTAKLGKNIYIGPFAVIEKNVEILDNSKIYPQVFIGVNSKIGKNTKLYPGVKIYYNTIIGDDCIIHSGAVIGADGFGFFPVGTNIKKLYQIGNVIIKNNVEIGANTTIDRATTGSTIIESNVKIDDQVHIAHNCEIGESSIIVSQVGIAGSVKVGKYVTLAGQTGVGPHVNIGDKVIAAAKTGISSDIKSGSIISGFPAKPHTEEKKIKAAISKLPEYVKKIRDIFSSVKRINHRLEHIEKYLNLKCRQGE